jgi:uncharacterized repeat protein (TIGR01451 family)
LDLEEPVPLDADTTYWIGLRIPSATSSPFLGLLVSDDNAGGFSLAGSTDGVNWSNINRDTLPFRLTGIPTGTPQADLGIAKISLTDTVQPGDTFEYLLQVENSGPDDDTNVIVQDTLMGPGVFTGIDNGNCTIQNNQEFTCTFDNMASGFLVFIEASVDINGDAPEDSVFENSFNISGDLEDPNQDNNSGMLSSPIVEIPTPPIIKFFEELVSIVQTFTIQILKPISPEPFNQLVSIVQGPPEIDVFQPLSPSPFNQLVSIVQGPPEIDVFQPLSPPAFSQSVAINQSFTIEIISEENTIEQLFANIETADLDPGITNALLATLKNIEVNLSPLEFSATSLVTTSSKSSTDEANSKKQNNEVCGKLDAFINKVNALTGKKINPEDAASFIATAEGIKENFGCT